jgi:hypothetical protein
MKEALKNAIVGMHSFLQLCLLCSRVCSEWLTMTEELMNQNSWLYHQVLPKFTRSYSELFHFNLCFKIGFALWSSVEYCLKIFCLCAPYYCSDSTEKQHKVSDQFS